MNLQYCQLTDDHLDEAVAFMRDANPFAQHTWGWDTGRFVDWRWGGNTLRNLEAPGFFARHGTLVRRHGTTVALVLAEVGADDHCILTPKEDRSLLAAVLPKLVEDTEGGLLTLFPADDAVWITDVLSHAGFERGAIAGVEWGFELSSRDEPVTPPQEFRIDTLAEDGEADYPKIDECLRGAFGGARDRVAILRRLAMNPMFRPALNIVARSADDRVAAYCRGTVDPDSGVCGIDPVATHPDFQGRGLGKAIVRACFATQARLGGRMSYIGSAPEPSPGSRLYQALGPVTVTAHRRWKKRSA